MEMIYRVKKPETIHRFMQENNIPVKILELVDNKPWIEVNNKKKTRKDTVKKNDKIHFFVQDEKRDEKVKQYFNYSGINDKRINPCTGNLFPKRRSSN